MRLILSFIACLLWAYNADGQLFDAALKKRLDDIQERDQRYRDLLSDFGSLNTKQLDSLSAALNCDRRSIKNCLWKLQSELDSANLVAVEQIIKKRGYPGKTLVGTPANETAWYVIQHSTEIKKYFPLIQKAGKQSELPMYLVAKMEDRLLMEDNKPQKYGTQAIELLIANPERNKVQKIYIWPVEDADNVNTRRREAGFDETIEQNARRLNAIFDKDLTIEKVSQMQVLPEFPTTVSPEIRARIKKAKDLVFPTLEMDTSSFAYYQQALNYNKTGDAVNAANALQKVSPYYLLYISPSPMQFEELLKKFTLTTDAKEKIRKHYQTGYATAKSPSYDSFQHFYINIKYLKSALRKETKQNIDSIEKKLRLYDSVGMKYLRSYVARQGWPSLAEGSMYAAYIAQRDIEYYYDYVLAMESAIYKGDISLQIVEQTKGNRAYYTDYMLVKHSLKGRHLKVQMNMLLQGQMPSKSFRDSVIGAVQKICPLKDLCYVLYTTKDHPKRMEEHWIFRSGKDFEKSVLQLQGDLEGDCPLLEDGVSVGSRHIPSDRKEDQLYLYVCY